MAEKEKSFEEKLKELEEIANKLDSSEISLDETIKLFEKGIKLSKSCSDMLEKAEQKIITLADAKNAEESDD